MIEKNLDFRSDTFTLPTQEMKEFANIAPLGDDKYREDPTVIKLEQLAAEMLGKEAGLFVTSGTQGNMVSILAQCEKKRSTKGYEILLEEQSHIWQHEIGGIVLSTPGLISRTIRGKLGLMDPIVIERVIKEDNRNYPRVTLLCLENTHNDAGGIALSSKQLKSNWDIAKKYNLDVHMDGERIFNAAIALNTDVKELAKYSDTVMLGLSKSLSCPVGSIVVGSEEVINRAREYRKALGGAMRQAGFIAACGIIGLTKMVDRLSEDHENAKILADGLQEIGIDIVKPVQTNLVYIDFGKLGWTGNDWVRVCNELGWKSMGNGTKARLVTHYGIEKEDVIKFLEGLNEIVPKKISRARN